MRVKFTLHAPTVRASREGNKTDCGRGQDTISKILFGK